MCDPIGKRTGGRTMKIQNGVLVSYTGQEEHLTIPREVTEIAAYAFHNCDSLRSVTIPDSVKKIGPCAFHGCPAFYTSFFAFRNLKNFFSNIPAKELKNSPAGLLRNGKAEFRWKRLLKSTDFFPKTKNSFRKLRNLKTKKPRKHRKITQGRTARVPQLPRRELSVRTNLQKDFLRNIDLNPFT